MSVIAFASGRSPGLTTAVHALAIGWPMARPVLVVELDPDGGSLAVRHELPSEPGLTSLAAAGRKSLSPDVVRQHCRRLADGTDVLLAPTGPDLVASALALLGTGLISALEALPGTDVLIDCGRLDRTSPALPLLQAASRVVVVVTPTVEGVAQVQARLPLLNGGSRSDADQTSVLTVGRRPYGAEEVAGVLGLSAVGFVADDRRGALQLASGRGRSRRGRGSELVRSAVVVAEELARGQFDAATRYVESGIRRDVSPGDVAAGFVNGPAPADLVAHPSNQPSERALP